MVLALATAFWMVLAFAVLHGLAWGMRGPLMSALRQQLDAADATAVGRLARRIASTVSAGTYRHDARAWDVDAESQLEARDYLPPPVAGEQGERPYFEVVSVTPRDPAQWEQTKSALRNSRPATRPS